MTAKIRTRNSKEIAQQRRVNRHGCWDHIICAPLWPLHGVNLGTLLRTCEAAGACMAVPHYPWVPQALSKGYTISQRGCVHWVRPTALGWLETQSNRDDTDIIAVELADESTKIADLKPARPDRRTIMVLGHEKTGIPDEALEFIGQAVEIPMIGAGSTLNVAVAGSMVLYRLAGLL
jgi:tRNA (guanosine-2'-O-)-methyltransferase